ncbi:PREDICTED: putative receptor-like protein kinase At3g47110 [Prunus mume]|uniref:Receptor-like protein kinase At3g47110 n=1 Tax=Prunus mume TaxID=102107 RepID=A0ABM1LQQ5_PRUMU|nr:PREDICTED: putative receptor-like protein kinase At3g47110 [Prunus mume]
MSLPMFSKVVLLLFHVVVANSLYSLQQQQQQKPSCHDEELSALLQFKKSFIITKSASGYNGSYPKVSSWKRAEEAYTSCCSWDSVECDVQTGHVIGLDLSSSCLYGSINSNSSLFLLVHLQRLNLADNRFNYSQIPSRISNLRRLTYLNLSASVFSGHVPSEVTQLSMLSSLDLFLNLDGFSGENLLKMDASNMRSLVQNLTSLEKLSLNFINISSAVPDSIANLSFLKSLTLRDCGVFGQFPAGVFKLPNLKILSLRFNQDLTGYLPEFNQSSPLMVLKIAGTSFSGKLPSSIENLGSLNELDVGSCSFSGIVPFSLGNLRQLNYVDLSFNKFNGPIPTSLANLTELTHLLLSNNNFSAGALSWLAKQTKLNDVYLESINLSGDIPSSLRNLTQLTRLNLPKNHLTGPIPSWLGNLTKLVDIYLSQNKLHGSLPESIYNVMNLRNLLLDENNLSGIVEFDKLLNLRNLIR